MRLNRTKRVATFAEAGCFRLNRFWWQRTEGNRLKRFSTTALSAGENCKRLCPATIATMKMPPEVLRLSEAFSATMKFWKRSATMTRSTGPLPLTCPAPARHRPAGLPPGPQPMTAWSYAVTARHAAQGGIKTGTWCSLPRLENGLYRAYTALAIAVLYATYTVTALASPCKAIICPDEKVYQRKISRLERR